MENNLNLETRTKVLEYSLWIETSVNTLLQSHLLILDKERTKNFGNKAGIPFKSKIDLLYDIEILTKEEHSDLELIMNFRNKFLHDIDSNSFTKILKNIDNGIKNRFKKFKDSDIKTENEEAYIKACSNLFVHNLKVLLKKNKERRISLEKKRDYEISVHDKLVSLTELSSKFGTDIMLILENSDLENPIVLEALNPLIERCHLFTEEYNLSQDFDKLEKLLQAIPRRLL